MRHPVSMVAVSAFALLSVSALATPAFAQFGGQPGGMGPGGGMGPPGGPGGEDATKEGPAEEAPEEEQQPADLTPLGSYPGQARHASKVIELNGDFRFRGDYFHKLNMDQAYVGGPNSLNPGPPPFPLPLECPVTDGVKCNSTNLGSANIRLRLLPTINITDQVRVMSEVHVFDNTILGSTPDSLWNRRVGQGANQLAPSALLYTTQDPPEVGAYGLLSSIRATRAWGEIDSEFGSLRFGRMPWHFGRGIAYNDGNCADCDGAGTTVDRLMALTQLYGHQVAASWDFGSQGHNIGMTNLGLRDPNGPPLDLSQDDDVLQLMAAITRRDDPRTFDDRAAMGELMFNYGAQFVYKHQGRAFFGITADSMNEMVQSQPPTRDELSTGIVSDVDARIYQPSLWMKLGWKALNLEAEASGVFGKIGKAGPLAANPGQKLTLNQIGWVLATDLRLAKNALSLGLETGGATGDSAENPRDYLNVRWRFVPQPPGDGNINDFKFSPDYHVDEILFRRIIGTVTNALYVKPKLVYWLDLAERRQIGLSAAGIYSMALIPVSTPGNQSPLGIEMNLGINYRNPADGIYGGVTWGVLWPLSGLDRRVGESTRPLWPRDEDATSAQVLRLFIGLKF